MCIKSDVPQKYLGSYNFLIMERKDKYDINDNTPKQLIPLPSNFRNLTSPLTNNHTNPVVYYPLHRKINVYIRHLVN